MGYDISHHPVDVALIKDRLIPFIMGKGTIDDLHDTIICNMKVAHRANRWGLALSSLHSEIMDAQREIAPKRKVSVASQKPQGFWDRLLGRFSVDEEIEISGAVTGVLGFNSELHVWGRPLLNLGETTEEALEIYECYLSLVHQPIEKVDEFALSQIRKLDRLSGPVLDEVALPVLQLAKDYSPLERYLKVENDDFDYDRADLESPAKRALDILCQAYKNIGRGILMPLPDSEDEEGEFEEVEPEEMLGYAPLEIINIAAQILPGWMGRGRVWPTILFDQIGVDASHIFEAPHDLFQDLLAEVPSLEQYLSTTIVENYCVGGYVPPEKMRDFLKLLETHKRDLIFAWMEGGEHIAEDSEEFWCLSSDYLKIYEPAVYAAKNGYGFIEAAEVYSGPFGWMN